LVRGDRGALDAHAVPLDRVRGVDRDLVVGGVAVLHGKVVVLQLDIQVGQDQLVLDVLPDDPGHLVAVEFDDGVRHLDLGHVCLVPFPVMTAAYGSDAATASTAAPNTAKAATSMAFPRDASSP